jgi:hypothetical protein
VQDGSRPVGNSVEGGNLIDIDRVRPDELADGGDTFREHVFNFAKHRRPEHYQLIVDRVGAGKPLG